MFIAYELKQPIQEVEQWSRDLIGYWLAFFKVKAEREEKARKQGKRSGSK